jgi:biopolymer transport protein ExbD/biopolymer transport protein TolR
LTVAFGRLERRAGDSPMSEINMTPLIDVMLVLLVIFIIAAPLMASRLQLDLPKLDGLPPSEGKEVLQLALDAEGRLFVADQPASIASLVDQARVAALRDRGTEVHLRADSRVPYGKVAELISIVQKAGLTRIGFVTGPPAAPAARTP